MPPTLHFMLWHWRWHCALSNSAAHPTFALFTFFIEKWRNNQPVVLVKMFIGGFLMPHGSVGTRDIASFNTALKNKKSTCAIGESVSLWWTFDPCQKQF